MVDREPLLHQFYDIFVAYGQREGQFLDDRRTAVVELLAVDADEADAFVLRNLFNQVGNCGESFGGTFFASQFAFEREFVDDRIDHEIHLHLFGIQVRVLEFVGEQFRNGFHTAATEGEFGGLQRNSFE